MPAIQTFNETFLDNAAVPQTGSKSGAQPSGPTGSAKGTPAIQKFDPAANLRVTTVVKQASPQSAPSGGKAKFKPSAVDSFTDGSV